MATWTPQTKNQLQETTYLLQESGDFLLQESGDLIILTETWSIIPKNTASYSNQSKNSTSWTELTKN